MKLMQKNVNTSAGPTANLMDDALKGFGVRITEGAVTYGVDFHLGKRAASRSIRHLKSRSRGARRAQEIIVGGAPRRRPDRQSAKGEPTFAGLADMIDEVDKPKLSARDDRGL